MVAIATSDITKVSSIPINDHTGNDLRLIDLWVEPAAGISNGDTLSAADLGVSGIRGLLAMTYLDGGAWVPHNPSTEDVDVSCEVRPRVAYNVAGSSASAPAVASDADLLTFVAAATRDAAWVQLLVQA